jgi:hypothetical protein
MSEPLIKLIILIFYDDFALFLKIQVNQIRQLNQLNQLNQWFRLIAVFQSQINTIPKGVIAPVLL